MAARREKLYAKLRGTARTWPFDLQSLWLGPDHLLKIRQSGFTEEYLRFYYRDIQTIIVRRTTTWWWSYGAFGICLFLLALPFAIGFAIGIARATRWDIPYLNTSVVLAGAFLAATLLVIVILLALIRWFRGPSVQTWLQTAVQTVELPSVNTLRRSRRFLARLRPWLVTAQGELAPDEMAARFRDLADSDAPVQAPAPRPLAIRRRPPASPCRGGIHRVLYIFLLADVLYTGTQLAFEGSEWFWQAGALVLAMTMLVLTIIALARQGSRRFPARLKALTWTALGYQVLWFSISIGAGVYAVFSHLEAGELGAADQPLTIVTGFGSMALSGILGIFGLTWLAHYRRSLPPPSSQRKP